MDAPPATAKTDSTGPKPRRSGAMSFHPGTPFDTWGSHCSALRGKACKSSTIGPAPASRYRTDRVARFAVLTIYPADGSRRTETIRDPVCFVISYHLRHVAPPPRAVSTCSVVVWLSFEGGGDFLASRAA